MRLHRTQWHVQTVCQLVYVCILCHIVQERGNDVPTGRVLCMQGAVRAMKKEGEMLNGRCELPVRGGSGSAWMWGVD